MATNGTSPYRFSWSGPAGFSATNQNITLTNVQPSQAGIYKLVATDFHGCTNTCQARLIVNPNPTCSISPPSAELCFGPNNCIDYVVTPSGEVPPYLMVWARHGIPIRTNTTSTSLTFRVCATNIGTTVFTALITDRNGCSASRTATNIVNPNPICAINPSRADQCFGTNNCVDFVVIPCCSEGPYTIEWSRAGIPLSTNLTWTNASFRVCATLLGTNIYTASISDNNGCLGSSTATHVVHPNPNCSVLPTTNSIYVGENAFFSVSANSGNPPYRFMWRGPRGFSSTNTSIAISNAEEATAGVYIVRTTDLYGCTNGCEGRLIVMPRSRVSIEYSSNNVRVFWPISASGFFLEETHALDGVPPWMQVPLPYQTNATEVFINVPAPVENKFYRLRKP